MRSPKFSSLVDQMIGRFGQQNLAEINKVIALEINQNKSINVCCKSLYNCCCVCVSVD